MNEPQLLTFSKKIILHCESVVFSGKSFVKRENLDRQLDRKGSKQ